MAGFIYAVWPSYFFPAGQDKQELAIKRGL
jgi:hypothetical protein